MIRREESIILNENNMDIIELVEDKVGINKFLDYCLYDIIIVNM